jgi:site-specific DNA recombinase
VRVGVYARVSTEEQAAGTSIGDQLDRCRKLAEAKGWEVVEQYIDEGVSGAMPPEDRPALRRLSRDVAAGKVDAVLCLKLDRLARSARVLLNLAAELDSAGTALVFVTESIDTSTASGRLFRNILASFAEFERDSIVERTSRGLRVRARQGQWAGGPPPYGYRLTAGGLEEDPSEAAVVRRIFADFVSGASLYEVAQRLTAEGVGPRRGRWSGRRVGQILSSETYVGRLQWGKDRYAGQSGGRRIRHPVDRAEWIEIAVPALVEESTWKLAKDRRSLPGRRPTRKGVYLLTGLGYCGACGSRMYVVPEQRDDAGRITRRARYRCSRQRGEVKSLLPPQERCPNKVTVPVDEADSDVQTFVLAVSLLPENRDRIERELARRRRGREKVERDIGRLEQRKEAILDKEADLLVHSGQFSPVALTRAASRMQEELAAVEAELNRARETIDQDETPFLLGILESWARRLDGLDRQDKLVWQALTRECVERVTFTGGHTSRETVTTLEATNGRPKLKTEERVTTKQMVIRARFEMLGPPDKPKGSKASAVVNKGSDDTGPARTRASRVSVTASPMARSARATRPAASEIWSKDPGGANFSGIGSMRS